MVSRITDQLIWPGDYVNAAIPSFFSALNKLPINYVSIFYDLTQCQNENSQRKRHLMRCLSLIAD